MNKVNFLLNGFGFANFCDFKTSTFGHMLEVKVSLLNAAAVFAFLLTAIEHLFGLNVFAFIAYAVLITFEWVTGINASLHRGEKHESKKLGRMILKIGVYSIPIYIFQTFRTHVDCPNFLGFELNPFDWIYWVILIVIIWQLLVSLLENLDSLEYRWAGMLIKIINRKFYKNLNLNGDAESKEETDAL